MAVCIAMKEAIAELDRFGRIVVPKAAREELGIDAGTKLEVRTDQGEIHLRPVRSRSSLAVRNGFLVATGKLHGDVREAIDADRDARFRVVAGKALNRRR